MDVIRMTDTKNYVEVILLLVYLCVTSFTPLIHYAFLSAWLSFIVVKSRATAFNLLALTSVFP